MEVVCDPALISWPQIAVRPLQPHALLVQRSGQDVFPRVRLPLLEREPDFRGQAELRGAIQLGRSSHESAGPWFKLRMFRDLSPGQDLLYTFQKEDRRPAEAVHLGAPGVLEHAKEGCQDSLGLPRLKGQLLVSRCLMMFSFNDTGTRDRNT